LAIYFKIQDEKTEAADFRFSYSHLWGTGTHTQVPVPMTIHGPLDLPDIDPDMKAEKTDPWGSTFAKTYEQTAWDKATGWSRWIKANKTRPNPMHESLIDGFDFDDPKEDNYGIK